MGRAHRRRVVGRIIESVGIGAAAGSGAAVLPMFFSALVHNDFSIAWMSATLVGSGAILGAFVSFLRGLPSRLDTAKRIDEQTASSDLFSTADQLSGTNDSAMRDYVLAAADALAHRTSLDTLALRRLGHRAWGGIVLSVVCVALATLLRPDASGAQRVDETYSPPPLAMESIPSRESVTGRASGRSRDDSLHRPEADNLSRGGDRMTAGESRAGRNASEPNSGIGGGTNRASELVTRERPANSAGSPSDPINVAAPREQAAAGGDGAMSDRAKSGDGNTDGVVNSSRSASVEKQSMTTVPAAGNGASSGSPSPAYRDLIREFFRTDR